MLVYLIVIVSHCLEHTLYTHITGRLWNRLCSFALISNYSGFAHLKVIQIIAVLLLTFAIFVCTSCQWDCWSSCLVWLSATRASKINMAKCFMFSANPFFWKQGFKPANRKWKHTLQVYMFTLQFWCWLMIGITQESNIWVLKHPMPDVTVKACTCLSVSFSLIQ